MAQEGDEAEGVVEVEEADSNPVMDGRSWYVVSQWICFLAFRKGAVICCGLDLDISGLTTKKNAVDPEQMSPRPPFELHIAYIKF